jgi:hypothetical protein
MIKLLDDALCTYEDLKLHLELESNQIHDDTIRDLINKYTKKFCVWCGISSFYSSQYTEYYDGNTQSILYLRNTPITEITSVIDDTTYNFSIDGIIDLTKIRIIQNGKGIFLIDNHFTRGVENVRVEYTAGYETIPEDLKYICIREVSRAFKHRRDWEVISHTLSDMQAAYIQPGLAEDTVEILSFYRNNWIQN